MFSLGKKRTVTNTPDGVGEYTQGFLTNKNRFVDRKDAFKIAVDANRLLDVPKFGKSLFSEDIC